MPAEISEYNPQFVSGAEAARRVRVARAVWCAVAAGAALVAGVIVLAPWAAARGWYGLSQVIYDGFRVACHQMPERSFFVWGYPLAVCARCTGLYAGALAGVLAYPLARTLTRADAPPRAWLVLAALPTAFDFALGVSGVWENTHLSRFSTAVLLGAAASFYIVPAAAGLGLRGRRRQLRAGALPVGGGVRPPDSSLTQAGRGA